MKFLLGIFGGKTFQGAGAIVVLIIVAWFGFDYSNKRNSNRTLKNEKATLERDIVSLKGEIQALNEASGFKDDRIKRDSAMYKDNIAIMQRNIATLTAQKKELEAQKQGLINGALCRKVVKNIWGKEKVTDELINCSDQ